MIETMPKKLLAFGEQKGMKGSIVKVLQAGCGTVSQEIKDQLRMVTNPKDLDTLLEAAATLQTLNEFKKILSEMTTKQSE